MNEAYFKNEKAKTRKKDNSKKSSSYNGILYIWLGFENTCRKYCALKNDMPPVAINKIPTNSIPNGPINGDTNSTAFIMANPTKPLTVKDVTKKTMTASGSEGLLTKFLIKYKICFLNTNIADGTVAR